MDPSDLDTRVVVVDTSAIVAALVRGDANHRRAAGFFADSGARFTFPLGIMSEIAYMADARYATRELDRLLAAFERNLYLLDCGDIDIPRIRALVRRYANLPLGYADATVIACAERLGGPVFTFDRRHFGVVAREGTIALVPEI